ncbi:hypothetical protein SODALDRAFT_9051 [Sodiomyces alkalinus F11]|uniref:Uncharacterized protein n=1 Tax=Sodiomyces alkalinus (strain CBS 110278 / VKM F-3762 / F11) TaxID=1314773 RepID=A0A3N2Q607_SODAK|nr:hypothetical protein SODALDRAFT_9051 [Sodiomyces alkalinus F11]ROT42170.1 hypothetical protein SODALDRAFT_9051 [Sodiomyces alkalinus F11]
MASLQTSGSAVFASLGTPQPKNWADRDVGDKRRQTANEKRELFVSRHEIFAVLFPWPRLKEWRDGKGAAFFLSVAAFFLAFLRTFSNAFVGISGREYVYAGRDRRSKVW